MLLPLCFSSCPKSKGSCSITEIVCLLPWDLKSVKPLGHIGTLKMMAPMWADAENEEYFHIIKLVLGLIKKERHVKKGENVKAYRPSSSTATLISLSFGYNLDLLEK